MISLVCWLTVDLLGRGGSIHTTILVFCPLTGGSKNRTPDNPIPRRSQTGMRWNLEFDLDFPVSRPACRKFSG
jgi:hypothetical protein